MDYEEGIKKIEAQGYQVQDGFINEYGERYFIFRNICLMDFELQVLKQIGMYTY